MTLPEYLLRRNERPITWLFVRRWIPGRAERYSLTADVVIVGKVTTIEKDAVDALPHKDATEKVAYKIAIVKIDAALVG